MNDFQVKKLNSQSFPLATVPSHFYAPARGSSVLLPKPTVLFAVPLPLKTAPHPHLPSTSQHQPVGRELRGAHTHLSQTRKHHRMEFIWLSVIYQEPGGAGGS